MALNEKYAQLMEWHDYAALEEVSEERERPDRIPGTAAQSTPKPRIGGREYQAQGGNPKSIRRGISRIAEQSPGWETI